MGSPFVESGTFVSWRGALQIRTLSTQIIAGFPGETESDHNDTRTLIRRNLFDFVDVFEFSNRSGADTEKMDGHLTADLIRARTRDLRGVWRKSKLKSLVGAA